MKAFDMVAAHEWLFADFGVELLSDDTARATRRIPIDHTTFHHLQWASAEAIATLVARPDAVTGFTGIREISGPGMQRLAGLLTNAPPDSHLLLEGDFHVDETIAGALTAMAVDVELTDLRA